jgi:hypothetical protein
LVVDCCARAIVPRAEEKWTNMVMCPRTRCKKGIIERKAQDTPVSLVLTYMFLYFVILYI